MDGLGTGSPPTWSASSMACLSSIGTSSRTRRRARNRGAACPCLVARSQHRRKCRHDARPPLLAGASFARRGGPWTWGSRYTALLGRVEMALYHRLSALSSSRIGRPRARVAKSTVTSVMSAAAKLSPATKGDIGEPAFEIGIEVHDAEPAALGDPEAEVLIEDIRIMLRERFAGWIGNQPRDVDPNRP